MVLLSEKQQRDLLILAGLADLMVGGRITGLTKKALVGVLKKALPVAGRAVVGAVPRALGTARLIAMRHPYVAAGALIYVGVTEREKIRALLEQGYDIVEERLPETIPTPGIPRPGIPGVEEILTGVPRPISEFFAPRLPGLVKRRRKLSGFNRAVSQGMRAVKTSTSYGGKGKIKPFSVVVKLASAKKKKKKAPKSGIRRRIWNAMKGLR